MSEKITFSQSCKLALDQAIDFSKKKKYEFLTIDTYLLFISKTEKGMSLFSALNISLEDYEKQILSYLEENIPKSTDTEFVPTPTLVLKNVREFSSRLCEAGKKKEVEEEYLFAAMFETDDADSFTLGYLKRKNITRFDIISYISSGKTKTSEQDTKETATRNYLNKFAINLNKKAKEGKIDKVIGRDKELQLLIEVLCQKKKNNPVLVGEAGVGKTSIIEGLAKEIEFGNVPVQIKSSVIYLLDLPSVLAGTKYRGDFEERLKNIIKEASNDKNVILAIDEVHSLIGSGSNSGSMDASNILKPALSNGEIKLIGATTYDEYRKFFEKEAALNRRFRKIDVVEPNVQETYQIMMGLKKSYEDFHNVKITDEAIKLSVDLSAKYINDKFFPDKAIDIIDLSMSKAKINKIAVVDISYIQDVFAEFTRIPIDKMKETEKTHLKNLETELRKNVFGQDNALSQVVNSLVLSKAKIIPSEKPIGSFLFAGPTGVGKTELAKKLADTLSIPLIRFDMSEYMEKHSVAKLIGTPPGYVGFDQGGLLVEKIKKNPYCVLLLDEIEKADSDILNALLQVMDYASLTDNTGKKADFKNVILIMTTNIGAGEISKPRIGFDKERYDSINRDQEIKKRLSPEFFNRLDSVVQFNPLSKENIVNVINKELMKLSNGLSARKIKLKFDNSLIDFILNKAYDPNMGARPIERFVKQNVALELSKEIIFNELPEGMNVKVYVKDDLIKFDYKQSKATQAKKNAVLENMSD